MRQLLIIADDLSGAADCANACMSAGLSAVVTFDETDHRRAADVLSVDCDTRHLEPDQAANRVAQIMHAYEIENSGALFVKKVDSALRGNVAAEIASALAERRTAAANGQRIVAVMAPAFPEGGRTTVGGYQMVHGRFLHETEMWVHNRIPGTSHIPSLLAQNDLNPAPISLEQVRSGGDALRDLLQRSALIADVLVCDAETDEDLRAIAAASLSLGRKTVWAGSAGLTHHLPHAAGLVPNTPPAQISQLCDGPTLFVIGSMSSVSHNQASLLAEQMRVNTIHIPPRILLAGTRSPRWARIVSCIEASLRAGRDTLVKLDGGGWIDQKERRFLTDALGVMLTPYREIVGALVASGGETARAVLSGWNVSSLQLISEVETGLPFSVAEFSGLALPILTKAGSFGRPETFLNCLEFLDNLERGAGTIGHSAQSL